MVRGADRMSEQREIERLSTLLNRLQDDVARLQSDIRNIGSSSTSISVAQPASRAVAHSGVTGVTANQHHTKNHASRHAPTQDDPVLLDEDDMTSDSDLLGATQQSIKAHVAAQDHDIIGGLQTLIEPTSTGIETKTGTGKGSTLDMSSLSYDRIWVHIIKGSTGYTSATILLQVCDNDSAVDAEWETLGTFTLTANETDSINKKWSFPFARLNITAFVGDDIKINLGATV